MYAFVVFLSFLQSVVGFSLMTSTVMRIKKPIKKHIIRGLTVMMFGITLLLTALIFWGIHSMDSFAIVAILVIQLAWFVVCADDDFFVSLFSFLTFANVYVSISFISDELTKHAQGVNFVVWHMVVRLLIYLIIIPLLFTYVRPRFRRLVEVLDQEWRAATLVPFTFLCVQAALLYYPKPYWHWEVDSWSRFIIVTVYVLFLAVYYLIYSQADALVEKYGLEKKQLLMAQQDKLWETELSRQKVAIALACQQRHDLHHHNAVILSMLQKEDKEGLIQYIEKFDESLDLSYCQNFCKHPIANSIFHSYQHKAKESGIKTSFRVNLPETMSISSIDLTCVLGNVLENALEGCMRLSPKREKEIKVRVKFVDQRLRIHVENTCQSHIVFAGEWPVTQKESGGTGIKSICYTAERYDGTAGFSLKGDTFVTQIVLNAPKKEGCACDELGAHAKLI